MNKKLKVILCIALSMVMVLAFVGCQGTATPEAEESASDTTVVEETETADTPDVTEETTGVSEPIKIGYAVSDFGIPFQAAIKNAAEERVAELGEDVVICEFHDSKEDAIEQIAGIQNFIAQGVDAIVINAVKPDTLADVCQKARDAGIALFSVNRRAGDIEMISHIGCDDVYAGEQLGALASKLLGGDDVEAKIALMQGGLGSSAQVDRLQGLKNYMEDNNVAWTLISDDSYDWKEDKAVALAQNILQRFGEGEIDCILTQGPLAAVYAAEQIAAQGRDDLAGKVAAVDMPKDTYAAIQKGEVFGTVLQDPAEQGWLSIDTVLAYFEDPSSVEEWTKTELPIVDQDNFENFTPTW